MRNYRSEQFKAYETWLYIKLFFEYFILRVGGTICYIYRAKEFRRFVKDMNLDSILLLQMESFFKIFYE